MGTRVDIEDTGEPHEPVVPEPRVEEHRRPTIAPTGQRPLWELWGTVVETSRMTPEVVATYVQ
mgnify:CR=1 FL=1